MTADAIAVAALTRDQARALTDTIKADLGSLAANVAAAFTGRAWEALGYPSWADYTAAEFTLDQYRLPKGADREQVLATLVGAGMSQRQIAAATGLNQSTISRALASGDANASPDPVADVRSAPDGWRLHGEMGRRAEEVRAAVAAGGGRPLLGLADLELYMWAVLADLAQQLHALAAPGVPVSARQYRGLAENALGLRLPLVWTAVADFLRAADRGGADVRGIVAADLAEGYDPTALHYAADVLALLEEAARDRA